MKRLTRYIVFEGGDGCGKTTQVQKLVDHLRAGGFSVLQTKEPGTPLCPLTMQLRAFILDAQYDSEMPPLAREYIGQAIRAIHLHSVIRPALGSVDYIVQDRGFMSGLAYGAACGNNDRFLGAMSYHTLEGVLPEAPDPAHLYDHVIYLKSDPDTGLARAQAAKREFAAGDAMESKGTDFARQVAANFDTWVPCFSAQVLQVDGKNVEQVFAEVLQCLDRRNVQC